MQLKEGLERSKDPLLAQHSNSRKGNTVFVILPDIVEKPVKGFIMQSKNLKINRMLYWYSQ